MIKYVVVRKYAILEMKKRRKINNKVKTMKCIVSANISLMRCHASTIFKSFYFFLMHSLKIGKINIQITLAGCFNLSFTFSIVFTGYKLIFLLFFFSYFCNNSRGKLPIQMLIVPVVWKYLSKTRKKFLKFLKCYWSKESRAGGW